MTLGEEQLFNLMSEQINALRAHPDRIPQLADLLAELKPHIPKVVNRLAEQFSGQEKLLYGV
jgi:hypothetical protein